MVQSNKVYPPQEVLLVSIGLASRQINAIRYALQTPTIVFSRILGVGMELTVVHSRFQSQRLSVLTAGFFSGPKVLLNGVPIKRIKGKYAVANDVGQEILVELRSNFVDPIPTVKIGAETIYLARKLAWYEYAWGGLPILRIFVGGGLGALIGIIATFSNVRILRSGRSTVVRYSLTGGISMLAFVSFFALATFLQILINGVAQ